jgi:spermidine/putrescine transport system substrate-binding protein
MNRRSRNRLVRRALTRRQFLGRAGAFTGAVVLGPAILTSCGGDDDDGAASGRGGGDGIRISNWIEYIDEDQELIVASEEAIGASVEYIEDVNDNNEYFATVLQPNLGQGNSPNRDGFIVTDWMAARVIGLEWVQELDQAAAPNLANVLPALANPPWDPGRRFSIPWQSIIAGIAYNIDITGRELTSVADLLDPAFEGRVTFLTEMRDTVGLFMLLDGKDPTTATFDDAQGAFDMIEEAKSAGQLRGFTGNEYVNDLSTGNLAACIAWSGDVAQITQDAPNIRFVIPQEGGTLSSDNFLIPVTSENAELASRWIDFFYDPVNAAQLTLAVQYISPVIGVIDELRRLGPEGAALADNPLVNPDEATLSRLKIFAGLDEEQEELFDERFAEISGA